MEEYFADCFLCLDVIILIKCIPRVEGGCIRLSADLFVHACVVTYNDDRSIDFFSWHGNVCCVSDQCEMHYGCASLKYTWEGRGLSSLDLLPS